MQREEGELEICSTYLDRSARTRPLASVCSRYVHLSCPFLEAKIASSIAGRRRMHSSRCPSAKNRSLDCRESRVKHDTGFNSGQFTAKRVNHERFRSKGSRKTAKSRGCECGAEAKRGSKRWTKAPRSD